MAEMLGAELHFAQMRATPETHAIAGIEALQDAVKLLAIARDSQFSHEVLLIPPSIRRKQQFDSEMAYGKAQFNHGMTTRFNRIDGGHFFAPHQTFDLNGLPACA